MSDGDAPKLSDPAPLGLIGLAVAAMVLGLTDLGWFNGDKTLLIPWAIFLGATAQLLAGWIDYKRGNIFGATAFTTYALLWYSVAATLIIVIYTGKGDMTHYAYGLLGFLIFSLILTVATVWTNKVFFLILVSIDAALLFTAWHVMDNNVPSTWAGIFLIVVSVLSFYGAAAVLFNTMTGKEILPMGKALRKV